MEKKNNQHDVDGSYFHPLEAIPFFKKWENGFVRNFIYTLIFNTLIAMAITLVLSLILPLKSIDQLHENLLQTWIISNVFGFIFWALSWMSKTLLHKIKQQHFLVIVGFFTMMSMFIMASVMYGMTYLQGFEHMRSWIFSGRQLKFNLFISLSVSFVLAYIWHRRLEETKVQLKINEEKDIAEAAKLSAAQANLRALQAQIEPHFLFNTLSNVLSLIDTQPVLAKTMLEKMTHYLRASLTSARAEKSTIGNEFFLMEQYLSILQVRMGERLKMTIELPKELNDYSLPPMLLQPLVENAIEHGIDPQLNGGELLLKATQNEQAIQIEISDNGAGFQGGTSNGLGLKNVRERLEQIYRGKAQMSITENQPTGTRIILNIPKEVVSI
jgi:sensor histidine kinase YesM